MVLYAVVCFMYLGCATNTSVDFIVEEPQTQSENNVDFSVDWIWGIPLYYFGHHPISIFDLKVETNENIADVLVSSYSIKAPELGIDFHESELAKAMIMDDKAGRSTIDSAKRFWKRIEINKIFLPDTIKNEKQLAAFKKVKHVFLTVTIEYVMGNEQKQSSITWKFRPRVLKSSALWDKWMSV
jgi:hypothetical protein